MKPQIKRFILNAGYGLLAFTGLIILYIVFAFGLSHISVDAEKVDEFASSQNNQFVEIFIKTNGVHTDIVMPVSNKEIQWSNYLKFSHIKSSDTTFNYIAMGWGDKGFYLETPNWSDLKCSVAFKATFGLGSTAIHTTYYNKIIENKFCKKIIISNKQYKRLVNYIVNSFQKNIDGTFIFIDTESTYGNTDAFYEANGSYSLLTTCNTWVNSALKHCGQKACLWTPFDTGIFNQYN